MEATDINESDLIGAKLMNADVIDGRHYFIGRLDQDTDQLTEVKTIIGNNVPPPTKAFRWELLSEDPVDVFVKEHCEGLEPPAEVLWNRTNSAYVTYKPLETAQSAGATAA